MKYLNDILINWNNSDIEDSGFLKASDIKKKMNYQLIYTLDKPKQIKIFDRDLVYFYIFKDKVYINDEHVELTERGFTVNEYEPGEYKVYIDGFDELNKIREFSFYTCTALTSITIPNSVKTIGGSAFEDCFHLTEVIIPNSVKTIDTWAFSGCTSLTSITIPNSVKTIGDWAFAGCTGLTSIIIPNSVTTIGGDAFRCCTNLNSVTILSSVKEIRLEAFYDCRSIETVYVEDIDKFNKIYFENGYSDPTCYGAKLIEIGK